MLTLNAPASTVTLLRSTPKHSDHRHEPDGKDDVMDKT